MADILFGLGLAAIVIIIGVVLLRRRPVTRSGILVRSGSTEETSDPPQEVHTRTETKAAAGAMTVPAFPIAKGTMVASKYRLERLIDDGGRCAVAEATHMTSGKSVALRFLAPGRVHEPLDAARLVRAAQIAGRIGSEHAEEILDIGALETGAPFIVTGLLHGNDLAMEIRERGALPLEDAIDYVLQACDAVAEAHAADFFHRDLRPAKLFLGKRPDGSSHVTVLTSMIPSLRVPPELAQQTRPVDHRADIYLLGLLLYELLAGKRAFSGDTLQEIAGHVLTTTPTPLPTMHPELPSGLAAVIEKAYARDPTERHVSVADFALALAPFAPARSQFALECIAQKAARPPRL